MFYAMGLDHRRAGCRPQLLPERGVLRRSRALGEHMAAEPWPREALFAGLDPAGGGAPSPSAKESARRSGPASGGDEPAGALSGALWRRAASPSSPGAGGLAAGAGSEPGVSEPGVTRPGVSKPSLNASDQFPALSRVLSKDPARSRGSVRSLGFGRIRKNFRVRKNLGIRKNRRCQSGKDS